MKAPKEITESYPFIIHKGCIYQYKGEVPEGATVLNAPNIDTAMGYLSEESVNEMLAEKDKEIEILKVSHSLIEIKLKGRENIAETLSDEVQRLKSENADFKQCLAFTITCNSGADFEEMKHKAKKLLKLV